MATEHTCTVSNVVKLLKAVKYKKDFASSSFQVGYMLIEKPSKKLFKITQQEKFSSC